MLVRVLVLILPLTFASRASAEETVNFNRDIRPILSDHCFQCHGPDESKRKAGLRLDTRESALAKLDSGKAAIVPKQIQNSELIHRITSGDSEVQMPPPSLGKNLSAQQIQLLTKWIDSGATYAGHWAFQSVQKPKVPDIAGLSHPVDRFIRARLARENLKPMPEASRETLIRRVSLDLTGLPPTPKEVDDFLQDKSADAYERVVDRLLKSPRYGEHMAAQWLDFARYADSNGFQTDSSRFQWPWRDWVIKAFNSNEPFNEFTIDQIAGDLRPNARPDQIVATGFNRNHRLNGEGGLIAEEWRIETVIDRVETTGSTWLGLTFNCCRCHDHKFDPISQKEFYQFFAFFNNNSESGILQGDARNTEPVISVSSQATEAELQAFEVQEKEFQSKLNLQLAELSKHESGWEKSFKSQLKSQESVWKILASSSVRSSGNAKLTLQPDGSYLASGPNPVHDTYEIVAPLNAGNFTGLLLETFVDPSLPQQSLGRYSNGNYVLSTVTAEITAPGVNKPISIKFNKAVADYSQAGWEASNLVGNNRQAGWAVDGPTRKQNCKVMLVADQSVSVPAEATIKIKLIHETLNNHNIGKFRLSTSSAPAGTLGLKGSQVPENIRKILEIDKSKRSDTQKSELTKYFRSFGSGPIQETESQIKALKAKRQELLARQPSVMVMKEMPTPRDAFVLIRGQYDRKGEQVSAGLPASLPRPDSKLPMNRLGLAKWMVQDSNPLTARVWVNRAWERFFGTGLVKTSENLGSQAEFPSHPELLDWLAAEFMKPENLPQVAGEPAHNWDMKALHKLLVLSATYRQSAQTTKELLEKDPENRLLARGPRFRLSGEVLRDQALFVSGLMIEKIGGPSVRPYMPEGVWDETSRYGDLRGYKPDNGEGLYRRSLYTIWKRTAAPPSMLIFDSPSREYCAVKRSRTNTPLQALSLLNEITFVEASRKFAERMLLEGGTTPSERLRYGFRLATSREPTPQEELILLDGLKKDFQKFRDKASSAEELLKVGKTARNPKLDPAELAAYTLTANVLLNLDEVVSR
ncbi:PSD1 domain-containing protein [Telmatocola sphagniphila]|uniref:PSD1 domain-containing protein n=1 Tax=Telmatocola sphagniphila TaxID=1123043 RepID=A0A8E6EUB4_9BACT|nr:PSD1 and planctomycete cytochrome C domain-containing protein [Telmatocola sphagniphila]QVL33499.1 PSD1 domain-containing protein [Telmatocola sphagniphila]